MGIKGIYKEIGAGTRIAFLRLAVDNLEKQGRPLRLAIDISIWQFQVQAARGGSNPAIRTLFYRLVRLLGMPVQPVFVFDGLNKPLFKRNKRSTGPSDGMATAMAKRMIRMFGFYVHDAPGEAEAECALLQQRGVVDAVLSEDVDTLMFGCTRTLRNWSAATTTSSGKGSVSGTLTHVTMYETAAAVATSAAPATILRTQDTGLDREGMVLVALMGGGDYLPEGVPGCGVKLACEAAKAGYGRSLCRIKRADTAALSQWRSNLQHELRTNDSKFFRTCHHKLVIPEGFPNMDILRYYTHPVVSPADVVERLRTDLDMAVAATPKTAMAQTAAAIKPKPIDVLSLRDFVAETFDWTNRGGAIKFIRVLAPGLLARMLLLKWSSDGGKDDADDDLDNEASGADKELLPSIVEGISRQRAHASTDNTPELRVSYVPVTVVGLDLERELDDPEAVFGRDGLALNSDDEFDEPPASLLPSTAPGYTAGSLPVASVRRLTTATPYDPTVPGVAWVPRTIVQIGAPGALEEWDQRQQRGKKGTSTKTADGTKAAPGRKQKDAAKTAKTGKPAGALDRFVHVTKNTGRSAAASHKANGTEMRVPDIPATSRSRPDFRYDFDLEQESDDDEPQQHPEDYDLPDFTQSDGGRASSASQTKNANPPPPSWRRGRNPWTLSNSQEAPRVTKNIGSGTGSQKRKYTRPATPNTTTHTQAATTTQSRAAPPASPPTGVISLLSSSPFIQARDTFIEIATSPNAPPPPATSFSSLAWSPLPLSKTTANPRNTATAVIANATGPKAKPSTQNTPRKQSSIRSFLSSQSMDVSPSPSKSPMPILLSDDEEGSGVGLQQRRLDDELLWSSSPLPPIFSLRSGKTAPRVHDRDEMPTGAVATMMTTPTKKTADKAKISTAKKRTRYVPRTSAAGYFREEAVNDEAADAALSTPDRSRRGWRHSEIAVVDLTMEGR